MSNIPTYDPATQDLRETITFDGDGGEVHTYTVEEKSEWRKTEYKRQSAVQTLPETLDDMNSGLVEIAGLADDNNTVIADIQDALCEIAELITSITTESEV